jgi:thiol:disulfide interchange protein DsbD
MISNGQFRQSIAILLLFLGAFFSLSSQGQSLFGNASNQNHPLPAEKAFAFSAKQINDKLALVWNISDDYYMYQDKLSLLLNGEDIIAAQQLPKAKLKEDPLFGSTMVYEQQLSLMVALPAIAQGSQLVVGYQGCWEGGVCYPPQTQTLVLDEVTLETPASTPTLKSVTTPTAVAQPSTASDNSGITGTDASWFTKQFNQASQGALILTFFLAGLGLALTPCVLPMVPILSNLIVGMNPKPGPAKSFFLSLTYVIAMAVTYSLAGVAAGLSGANLQAALQHPAVIGVMVLLFVVFAAAMFDWITIQMPAVVQNRLNNFNQRQSSGHFWGVGIMGVISALVVGPCVAAPLAGALLYISQTGDPYTGGMALLALGLGMGAPLLAVGTSAGKFVPKAGAWMNRVKYGFGFLMLGMAIWMLDRVLPVATVPLVMLLTLVAAMLLWQVGRWQPPAESIMGRTLAYVVASVFTVYSLTLMLSLLAGQGSLLKPLAFMQSSATTQVASSTQQVSKVSSVQVPGLLQQAQQLNKPALLDFYADWCVSCKELDSFVFPDPVVQQALADYVFIKVDVTANSQIDKDLLAKYELVGPPALLLFDRQGNWVAEETIVGVPTPEQFAQRLTAISQ